MARTFNGSTDQIALNEPSFDFERTQPLTFAAWVYPDVTRSGGNVNYAIYSKLDSASPNSGIEFALSWNNINSTNKTGIAWFFVNTFGSNCIAGNSTIADIQNSAWSHVALTYDGNSSIGGVVPYINGLADTRNDTFDNLTSSILNNITPYLGSRNNANTFFKGGLAEFACWTAALSVGEIVALSKGMSPAAIRTSQLLSYLPIVRANSDYMLTTPTITGTTVTDHPRIIMPPRRQFYRKATAPSFIPAWAQNSNLPVIGTGTY